MPEVRRRAAGGRDWSAVVLIGIVSGRARPSVSPEPPFARVHAPENARVARTPATIDGDGSTPLTD